MEYIQILKITFKLLLEVKKGKWKIQIKRTKQNSIASFGMGVHDEYTNIIGL